MKESEIVTISVLTYNSAKFVTDTLESIKAQTYAKIILQIADDYSTDNTISICEEWISKNKHRFIKTKIIVPEKNTGISANCNRAWDACESKYFKSIAGDDILLPKCIEENIKYVEEHPECIMLFSRMKSFGGTRKQREKSDNHIYNYDFFNWSSEEQYDYLYNGNCCIPAPTAFVNITKIRELGLRHDERIPLQEDVAKWMNALKLGIRFHFMDKVTVNYRLHNGSLSTAKVPSPRSRESVALTWFYYHFQNEYEKNPEKAIKEAVARQMDYYNAYYRTVNSYYYKLGFILLTPFRILKNIIKKQR